MEVVSAFAASGTSEKLEVDTDRAIETFVFQLYEPGSTVVDVDDLSWKLFTNWRLKSYLRHEEPYMKPLPGHITRPWCGVRILRFFGEISSNECRPPVTARVS